MNVIINGNTREVPNDCTVEQLVIQLGLTQERIAIEYNRDILESTEYAKVTIMEGDTLEIVRFVGGG